MIDERCAIWNVLHDGGIGKVERTGSDLKVKVDITYLAKLALPGSQQLLLTLHGCSAFEFENWDDETVIQEPREFEALDLDILSTDSEALPAKICTTKGYLTVDFDALSIELEDGSPLSFQQLDEISAGYWERFANRSRSRPQAADD